jgi:ATP-dependent helicase/nuclease subunit A
MNKTKWTEEQLAAIKLKGQLLVAAAAGSGKTAVLVERILRQVVDYHNPVDVDKFLVVTFTKAAANEMRERIGKALDEAILHAQDKDVERLFRQRTLLAKANITTLHSFCSELIRKYFYLLELDPAFRIADQAEADLLKQDVLEDLFEARYAQEDTSFLNLVNALGSDRDDLALMDHVLHLYEFAYSHLQPELWLDRLNAAYEWSDIDSLMTSQWGIVIRKGIFNRINEGLNLLEQANDITMRPGGPAIYAGTLQTDIEKVQILVKYLLKGDWAEVEKQYPLVVDFSRLPPLRSKAKKSSTGNSQANSEQGLKFQDSLEIDEHIQKMLQKECKELRDSAKKKLNSLKEEVFAFSIEQQIPRLREMGIMAKTLGNLVIEFSQRYALVKTKRNVLDFTDLEHFAIRLLEEDGQPSLIAQGLQKMFSEVLVDEYQDINSVQERILQMVSRNEELPNLFMVGDVKQSIYRFRMADPSLFLTKYDSLVHWKPNLTGEDQPSRLVIDLNRNFRSRIEIVKGVNFLFRQIMTSEVGEISYDDQAALQYGASFISGQDHLPTAEGPIEVHLIDAESIKDNLLSNGHQENTGEVMQDFAEKQDSDLPQETIATEEEQPPESLDNLSAEDLDNARIEARLVSERIQELIQQSGLKIYDSEQKNFRQLRYSDIVVLMRSYSAIAPIYVEEFQDAGIPVYAETTTGYFGASEVETILSLLKVIDNPHFDIPLAAVLRSPLVNLNGSDLGKVRLMLPEGDFYEALTLAVRAGLIENDLTAEITNEFNSILKPYEQSLPQLLEKAKVLLSSNIRLHEKIAGFWFNLQRWRSRSRQTSLSELIWSLYEETGYLAYVGTLPSGLQRQANLRVLYDRACRYEATRYRGLFRFLRFLERFQGQGKDMGNARILGEKEDVVRLITVHASKGLEFPFVFVVGLGRNFNTQDLKEKVLLHSKLGLGMPIIDVKNSVRYPSIIQYALKQCLAQEALAEELRILYVALTRAKERLFLYGTLKHIDNALRKWQGSVQETDISLSDGLLRNAKCFLDWIGPALARHPQDCFGNPEGSAALSCPDVDSRWEILMHRSFEKKNCIAEEGNCAEKPLESTESNILADNTCGTNLLEYWFPEVERRLSWKYPYQYAVNLGAKTSVSELKRLYNWQSVEETALMLTLNHESDSIKRPKFIQTAKPLTAAERGTALHTAMQHLPLQEWGASWLNLSASDQVSLIDNYLQTLVQREILNSEQKTSLQSKQIVQFLSSNLGQRLLSADQVLREIPFNLFFPSENNENVLLQGVIDAVILTQNEYQELNAEILDYKTDTINTGDLTEQEEILRSRYTLQLVLYSLAVERLLKVKVTRCSLYSFYLRKEISIDTKSRKDFQLPGLSFRGVNI